jgi:tripeptide aminopeptidase
MSRYDSEEFSQRILNRFLTYVKIDTQSDRHRTQQPTTPGQWDLLRLLTRELEELGIEDIDLDDKGYLIARIPSNLGEGVSVPVIGFMAHVDTAGDMSGRNVTPQVIERYDGGDIPLGDSWVLSPAENPQLLSYVGQTLITTDGTTLLGADDKAGIAEIMTAAEYLMQHPEISRGTVELIFTTDEETGTGMDEFPYEKLRSRCCYTLDGGHRGDIEAECFNADKAEIDFTGVMYHLGAARGRLVNAVTMAAAYISMLPQAESPEATDGRYGYYCPLEITGTAEHARITVYLRDFDAAGMERRRNVLRQLAETVESLYPGGAAEVACTTQYLNMIEYISKDPQVLEKLDAAAQRLGLELHSTLIRGGTDGARLCEKGIPTPNIFTGGYNFHSRYEWAALSVMAEASQLTVELIRLWAAE